jgi:hypothetical protein
MAEDAQAYALVSLAISMKRIADLLEKSLTQDEKA